MSEQTPSVPQQSVEFAEIAHTAKTLHVHDAHLLAIPYGRRAIGDSGQAEFVYDHAQKSAAVRYVRGDEVVFLDVTGDRIIVDGQYSLFQSRSTKLELAFEPDPSRVLDMSQLSIYPRDHKQSMRGPSVYDIADRADLRNRKSDRWQSIPGVKAYRYDDPDTNLPVEVIERLSEIFPNNRMLSMSPDDVTDQQIGHAVLSEAAKQTSERLIRTRWRTGESDYRSVYSASDTKGNITAITLYAVGNTSDAFDEPPTKTWQDTLLVSGEDMTSYAYPQEPAHEVWQFQPDGNVAYVRGSAEGGLWHPRNCHNGIIVPFILPADPSQVAAGLNRLSEPLRVSNQRRRFMGYDPS